MCEKKVGPNNNLYNGQTNHYVTQSRIIWYAHVMAKN